MVQRNAMRTWEHGEDFLTNLKADKGVTGKLSAAELEAMFDEGYHFKHVDTIFRRVFGEA
jgi:adenylosuccinate lyase